MLVVFVNKRLWNGHCQGKQTDRDDRANGICIQLSCEDISVSANGGRLWRDLTPNPSHTNLITTYNAGLEPQFDGVSLTFTRIVAGNSRLRDLQVQTLLDRVRLAAYLTS